MADELNLAELEQRLFAKPVDEWTPNDWLSFFGAAHTESNMRLYR